VHVDEIEKELVAVHVTVLLPNGNTDPETGLQEVLTATTSVAVADEYDTMAERTLPLVCVVMDDGQVMTGALFCETTTGNVQVDLSPTLSNAVHVTDVVATANDEPLAGVQVRFLMPEPSVAVGVNVT